MHDIINDFFSTTEELVRELHGQICESSSQLQQTDAELDQEEIRHALAMAIAQALLQPCGSVFVYDPRWVPKWMEGIGLPNRPSLGR